MLCPCPRARARAPLCYILAVSGFLWRLAKITALPALLLVALFAVLWGLTYCLPSPGLVKLAAAAAAAGLGLIQAESLCAISLAGDAARVLIRLVVAVIWIGCALGVAGPFLAAAVGGGAQKSMQTELQSLRAAIDAYRRAQHGRVPARIEALAVAGRSAGFLATWQGPTRFGQRLLPHEPADQVEYYGKEVCRGSTNLRPVRVMLKDTGRWGYIGNPESPCAGTVFIDCTHTDFSGRLWADY